MNVNINITYLIKWYNYQTKYKSVDNVFEKCNLIIDYEYMSLIGLMWFIPA